MSNLLSVLLTQIESIHYPISGESIADRKKYCAVCTTLHTGQAKVWPCKTLKLLRVAASDNPSQQKLVVEQMHQPRDLHQMIFDLPNSKSFKQ